MPSLDEIIELKNKIYGMAWVDLPKSVVESLELLPMMIAEIEAWHMMAATQHCFVKGSASKQDLDEATRGLTEARMALEEA